jgi:hypothetical protein
MVVPYAEATIDGKKVGRLSSRKLPVEPGEHIVVLEHPDYQPLRRKLRLVSGETLRLVIDLSEEAIPKRRP